jgi:hypothetical protein
VSPEIIEPGGQSQKKGTAVSIGDNTVSLELIQDAFKILTKKNQTTTKSYTDAIRLSFEDINQLNLKIMQTCQSQPISPITFSIVIFYVDDTKDSFTTF